MVKMSEAAREVDASEEGPRKRIRLDSGEAADASTAEEPSGSGATDVSSLVEELPKEISEALDELDACQRDIDTLNEKASEEILKVEQKFNGLRKPMYGKRTEIISKIPQFWLTAFSNHPQMAGMIDEEEEKCLQYLRDMVVEENDDIKSGYKIKFIFEANPYIENTELVKDIHLPYGSPDERPYVVSTQIKWKKGMDLLKVKDKKPKKRGRWVDNPSFLEWLTQNNDPTSDEIAEILKDEMWPNPMQYYLAPDVDCDENGMDDDDDDDEVGDEDDSEDQDDAVVVVEEEEDDDEGQMGEGEEDVEDEEGGDGGSLGQGDPEDDDGEEDEEP